MTTITPEQVLKTKQNFSGYVEKNIPTVVTSTIANYQSKSGKVVVTLIDLTQKFDTLINAINNETVLNLPKKPYFAWMITNPKEQVMNFLKIINDSSNGELGFFVFKAFLNGDKIDFECLLKPELVVKQKREVNTNTPSKQLQKTYWELYIELCDASDYPDMQIKDALPRHYQNISIGKAGVQILQTINTQNNYVASEIAINNNKEIFEKLLDHKEEIEKEVGKLEWDSKENVKSAKIRKTFKIDVNNPENHKKAILEHVKMGSELKVIVHKYL